jgi:hypothetical protein
MRLDRFGEAAIWNDEERAAVDLFWLDAERVDELPVISEVQPEGEDGQTGRSS